MTAMLKLHDRHSLNYHDAVTLFKITVIFETLAFNPFHSLDTHWKHQGVSKETSGMKWVNINYFLLLLFIYI